MNNLILAEAAAEGSSASSLIMLIVMYGVIFVALYFIFIRPSSKQRKAQSAMQEALEVGDSVLTTAGFYGVIIDITDDTVIVEFGNNKNCRIPMQKSAIVESEKPAVAKQE